MRSLRTRFCLECENFEDRAEIDEEVLCAQGHTPRTSCLNFQDRVTDAFYSYIYQAYLSGMAQNDAGRTVFEERFSRNLSSLELTYACLVEYFQLGLDYTNFHRCWKTSRKNYKEKLPVISKIFDASSQRFELYGDKTNLEKVFLDLLSSTNTSEECIDEISEGHYQFG